MKHLKALILRLLLVLVRFYVRFLRLLGGSLINEIVIVPQTYPGSIGDAAMITGAISRIRTLYPDARIRLFSTDKWGTYLDKQPDFYLEVDNFYFFGSTREEIKIILKLAKVKSIFMIGADVLDGHYNPRSICARLSVLDTAANLGIPAVVLASSYNKDPETTTKNTLISMHPSIKIFGRDPESFERMKATLKRPIAFAGDLAFQVEANDTGLSGSQSLAWIKRQREAGKLILGVNINYLQIDKKPELFQPYVELVSTLAKQNVAFVLVPHDFRGKTHDLYWSQRLRDSISSDAQALTLIAEEKTPGRVKALMRHLDGLVSGRMHAIILAAGVDTPAVALTYQNKFEGMYKLLGLQDKNLLIDPELCVSHPERMQELTLAMLANRASYQEIIRHNFPAIRRLSERQFGPYDDSIYTI
jgi:polysaccharide pyruvyl transferase WcaK-like protein